MERLKSKRLTRVAITLAVAWSAAGLAAGQELATIVPTDYLLLPAVGEYGRLPLHRDAVESQLVAGGWKVPADGDVVGALDGKSENWLAAKADDDGALETGPYRGGWAVTTFDSPAERVMILEAAGHATVYVNGETSNSSQGDTSGQVVVCPHAQVGFCVLRRAVASARRTSVRSIKRLARQGVQHEGRASDSILMYRYGSGSGGQKQGGANPCGIVRLVYAISLRTCFVGHSYRTWVQRKT